MQVVQRIDQVLVHIEELYLRVQELETLLGAPGDGEGHVKRLRAELRALEATVYDQMPKGV